MEYPALVLGTSNGKLLKYDSITGEGQELFVRTSYLFLNDRETQTYIVAKYDVVFILEHLTDKEKKIVFVCRNNICIHPKCGTTYLADGEKFICRYGCVVGEDLFHINKPFPDFVRNGQMLC